MAENNAPGGPPADAAAPAVAPRAPWMVLFALFGAGLTAYHWASTFPVKPLATFLLNQAWGIGLALLTFSLPGLLQRKSPLRELRNFVLPWASLYLVGLVPFVASMTVEWEGGWLLGIAGTAAGAAAGAVTGWVFARWTLPDLEKSQREPGKGGLLPAAFAVLFALFGAYNWGIEWLKPGEVWAIGVGWLLLAVPGALVGRPFAGLLAMSPFVLVALVPLAGSMTVGWDGGWVLGIAGAAVGAAAGAVNGWMFNRWIMPEYGKRRARTNAAEQTGPDTGHVGHPS